MKDLYSEVTNRIIEQLEAGCIPWRKPWAGITDGAFSHVTGRPYSLLNQMLLGEPGEYITFNQCKQEGGTVKKGAKARLVVFWKMLQREKMNEDGTPVLTADGEKQYEGIPVLRYFQVFRLEDCEGIKSKYADRIHEKPTETEKEKNANRLLLDYTNREKIRLEMEISDKAYYSPNFDYIHLPIIEQFDNVNEFYSTAFHEATHSTGHASRLNRFSGNDANAAFGSESYSKEELVAEIGSACILHELGIETPASFQNSAAYIKGWLRVLKDDKRFIISAAARAEKAVKMILNIKEKQDGGE